MAARPWVTSYQDGVPASLEPYPSTSMYQILSNAAARFPGATATVFFGGRLTYVQLLAEVDRFSRALASLGIGKGDRVGLILPNCPQYVIAYYAALRLGAVIVGNNPLYSERELQHQLTDAGIEVCVVLDSLYPKFAAVRDASGIRTTIVAKVTDYMGPVLKRLAPIELRREAKREGHPWPPVPAGADVRWWRELMSSPGPEVPAAEIDPGVDLAGLIYTGGTTGLSKGAMLTHANLVANLLQCEAWFMGVRPGDEAVMCVLPFFHSYGMTIGMNLGIHLGAKLILVPRFELKQTLKAVQKERASLFPGVPRLYIAINESPLTPKYHLESIRRCVSGAAPLPVAVARKFESITGGRLVEGYGLTETSPVTHANPLDGRARPGSIGLPIPDTDCRLVDLDDWTKEAPPGEPGELAIAGPQVMQGYWNRPEETAAMIRQDADGTRWLLSGDIATVSEDGFFSIVDRKKDMIIVSGFNVYPTDIEQVLYHHPKIEKVCVVGVPDDRTGEAVKAFVVLKRGQTATPEEIVAFCRDPKQGLTGYRVPSRVEFRDQLPETLVGKVLRRVLLAEELSAADRS
ncbi:MAG TPA: long-chain fatty acid--CoA ligase [Actinomycetota bacterium]